MAATMLTSTAHTTGLYAGGSAPLQSEPLTTILLSGLNIEKAADRDVWTSGALTFTVTITNEEALSYTDVTLAEELDPALVTLVPGSARVNGVPAPATYDEQSGLLVIALAGGVAPGAIVSITYQVQKK